MFTILYFFLVRNKDKRGGGKSVAEGMAPLKGEGGWDELRLKGNL